MQRLVEFDLEPTLRREPVVDEHRPVVVRPAVRRAAKAGVAPMPDSPGKFTRWRIPTGASFRPLLCPGCQAEAARLASALRALLIARFTRNLAAMSRNGRPRSSAASRRKPIISVMPSGDSHQSQPFASM